VIISQDELNQIVAAKSSAAAALLGMHRCGKGLVVRAFVPDATACAAVELSDSGEKRHEMERLHDSGLFEGFIPNRKEPFPYRIRVENQNREVHQIFDPYSFRPVLSEQDLYLFNEGNEHRIYEKLGAHLRTVEEVSGVHFSVWAPAARRVSVVGNFNRWDGRCHQMRPLGSSGVWEIFVPGLVEGEMYKFEILGADGHLRLKTDPYGAYFEGPPNNASIVCDTRRYRWGDHDWMNSRRANRSLDRPISIYEVHLGSWKRVPEDGNRPLTYREMAPELAAYVLEQGFTHVEVLPVAEHPFAPSWGYQVTGFFAPTHRFGAPEDFMFFVDYLHQKGIGVIVDWVPGHFPRDSFALAEFDGTHLYEHQDPRMGAHQDWGTLIFNYGRHEVRNFLIANALSWFDRYHIDGLRVDAVASMLYLDYSRSEGEWIPNRYGGRENIEAIDFLRAVNSIVHEYYPGALMMAEESTSWGGVSRSPSDGGLGFDFKWNMGWMNDTLRYFSKDPLYRRWHHNDLTFGMLYQYSENFVSVFSHDEVVHGKGSMLMKMGAGSITEKAHHLRSLYGFMWCYPGKKLLFMGSEFGQSSEWHYDQSLDWHLCEFTDHEGIRLLVRDLNRLYRQEPALSRTDFNPEGFRWINANDADSGILSFARLDPSGGDVVVAVCHFTPVTRYQYQVGVPCPGYWREILNTDSEFYGGSGVGNFGGAETAAHPADGYPQSLTITVPPSSVSLFKWSRG
jgi:1,4-alpha-glucan branching enzyme